VTVTTVRYFPYFVRAAVLLISARRDSFSRDWKSIIVAGIVVSLLPATDLVSFRASWRSPFVLRFASR
jgi:hypothetical protein